jgi:hypothetical protein
LESTGIFIFAGRSQELELHYLQSNLLRELDCYTLPSPRGPSKRYTNLVIWSIPRVNTVCAWVSTSSLPCPSSQHHLLFLLVSSSTGSVYRKLKGVKFNCSCTSGILGYFCLLPTFKFNSSVLLNYSGCNCHLPTLQVQLLAVLQDYSDYNCFLRIFQVQRFYLEFIYLELFV